MEGGKQKIMLFASEVAGLIGKNPYEKPEKCWNTVFQRVVKDGEAVLIENKIEIAKTDQRIIKEITEKNGVKLSVPSFQTRQYATLADLNQDKTKILAEIEANTKINESDKKKLKKSMESQLQKDFGTKEETSITTIAEKLIGKPIEKTNKFMSKTMFETANIKWCIGGRVDGKTPDNEIVEIKNRMRRLFYEVKEYELVQLMLYLFIHDSNGGYLVEGFKSESKLLSNHDFISFNKEYFDNDIFGKMKERCELFDKTNGLQNPKFFLDELKKIS